MIKNDINLLLVLGKSGGHLWFYPQCNVLRSCLPRRYVRHTWRHYDRHQSHKSVSNMSKNGTDWLFNFGKVATILDVTHNAKPEVFFGQTTMSGIPENPMVDTKIMNLHQLCTKLALVYCLTLGSGGHLRFLIFFFKFLNGENSTQPWISLYTYQLAIIRSKKNN